MDALLAKLRALQTLFLHSLRSKRKNFPDITHTVMESWKLDLFLVKSRCVSAHPSI